ncbi:glucosidase 2 subunit beta [Anabrus simplex]|uniref:glucosidase 2 subunit beta n=1 Tax=Anabrus simplex TaxID=316456 RepID=UPI0035A36A8B
MERIARPVTTCPMMWAYMNVMLVVSTVLFVQTNDASEILRPRGVSISRASFYVPDKDFTCFDGSSTIPFSHINDDYCDCEDGSDEPGTAACPNGTFHCTNAGHRPVNIPSSRVNDGICDCCDTSDEYASHAICINNCNELGRAARVEAQKLAELRKQGSELKVQLSKRGKQIRQEKQERLNQLEKDKEEAEKIKQEKESLKLAAELLENNALEKYRKVEEEEKEKQQEIEKNADEREAFELFQRLDSNQDNKLQISELQTQQTFDQNRDGGISEEEAKFFLDGHDEMSWEDYLANGWPRMKPLVMLDQGLFVRPTQTPNQGDPVPDADSQTQEATEPIYHPPERSDEDDDDDEEEDEEDQDEEDDDQKQFEPDVDGHERDPHDDDEEELEEGTPAEEPPTTKYDDETQKLIDVASRARSEFEEADRAARDIQREIQQIKDSIEKDYGPEEEFAPLDGECYEYSDSEYIYKLCPFDQATQRSKSGGSDTRLGTWSGWVGPQGDKYLVMLYDKGQSCWNGPQRSTHVRLSCGTENAITSVSEPNRCEYLFEFVTPAICHPGEVAEPPHDEL